MAGSWMHWGISWKLSTTNVPETLSGFDMLEIALSPCDLNCKGQKPHSKEKKNVLLQDDLIGENQLLSDALSPLNSIWHSDVNV